MTYQISRDGQEFGPYSLSDVQRYVGTGNILLTDLARAEGSTDWLPVSQVIGTIAVAQPQAAVPYAAMPQYPDAPNLHWALVLLFGFLSCGIFIIVWEFIQTSWMKRVQPDTKALLYNIAYVALWGLNIAFSIGNVAITASNRAGAIGSPLMSSISLLITLGYIVLLIVYRFAMRSSMEKHFTTVEPIGLTLSGVMTFFFGCLYFQYHFNRINEIKRAYRISNPY
ncbi:DUF4339 domain-containing protein [Granulicella arctica]|uniref:DUF4339 domain-containing protein n=1 Tax=Granulicella arctica TaxID=940613 RepID=UPI0021DF8661|nr:DUF4339 domain-containing protein [Granulicella arctica]